MRAVSEEVFSTQDKQTVALRFISTDASNPTDGFSFFFPSKGCNKWDLAYPLYFQCKALLLPQHVEYYYKILSNSVWILTNLFFQTGTRHLDNVFPLHNIVVHIRVLQLIY